MNPWYTDYSEYLERFFPGRKVQKLSINLGMGCPNRDGTIGTGGCIYCNNKSFTPAYCFEGDSVRKQIEAGKRFFAKKYKDMQYLAYFQSYTSTHNLSVAELKRVFKEALRCEGIVGLIIGTRPDCIPQATVDMLSQLNKEKPVFVELGIESLCDETLKLINRGHDAACSKDAIRRLSEAGLHTGVHLIAGLPGEDDARFLQTVSEICSLSVESIKLHHLQVLKDTVLEKKIAIGELVCPAFTSDAYLELCLKALAIIPRTIAVERFLASSPPEMVVTPRWGMKNYQFTNLLHNRLRKLSKQ